MAPRYHHLTLAFFALLAICCSGARANRALGTRSLLETDYSLSKGPYGVTNTTISDPHNALVYTPYLLYTHSDEDEDTQKFPAIIFAHGLCGPAVLYDNLLVELASYGYVVIANQEQETCKSASLYDPIRSGFAAMDNLQEASNGKDMLQHLEDEVDYLHSRDDVDASKLALVGHSMGGGAVIDLAAKLADSNPGLVQAVVAIAPWNGIPNVSIPSTVAGDITAPMLIFCSDADQICPCSGKAGKDSGVGSNFLMTSYANTVASMAFGTTDLTWHGGVDAIFEDAKKSGNATLFKFKEGGHFALAGISEAEMQKLGKDMLSDSGLGSILGTSVVDTAIGMGEGEQSTEVAEEAGKAVLYYTTNFLNDYMDIPKSDDQDEVSVDELLSEAKADSDITVEES